MWALKKKKASPSSSLIKRDDRDLISFEKTNEYREREREKEESLVYITILPGRSPAILLLDRLNNIKKKGWKGHKKVMMTNKSVIGWQQSAGHLLY